MAINDTIMELIKKEITEDPEKLGYAGKTDVEIQDLLNKPYTKQVITEVIQQSRISSILAGVPFTPNVVDAVDVKSAQEFIVKG